METPLIYNDEREGKPSASCMERLKLCPGSWRLSQGLPHTSTEDSERGDRIHAKLAGKDVELTHEEQKTYDLCVKYGDALVKDIFGNVETRVYNEERLWKEWREYGKRIDGAIHVVDRCRTYSAKFDRLVISGRAGILIDWKTGRGENTPPANNYQLRVQSVLVAEEYGLSSVYATIIAPWDKRLDPVLYDEEDIRMSSYEINDIVAHATAKDVVAINPSEKACAFCPAAIHGKCEKALSQAISVIPANTQISKIDGKNLRFYMDRVPFVKKMCDKIMEEGLRRLKAESDDAPEGYVLANGRGRKQIDTQVVWNRIKDRNLMSAQQYISCCNMVQERVKDTLHENGLSAQDIDDVMEYLLSGFEEKQGEPRVEKVK